MAEATVIVTSTDKATDARTDGTRTSAKDLAVAAASTERN